MAYLVVMAKVQIEETNESKSYDLITNSKWSYLKSHLTPKYLLRITV